MIGDVGHSSSSRNPKATIDHVIEILAVGAMTRKTLISTLMKKSGCGFSTAKTVISNAQLGAIVSFTDKDKITNRNVLFFCLPEHLNQWVKVGVKVNLTLNPDLDPG